MKVLEINSLLLLLLNISREGKYLLKRVFFFSFSLLLLFSAQKFQIRAENYKFVRFLHWIKTEA